MISLPNCVAVTLLLAAPAVGFSPVAPQQRTTQFTSGSPALFSPLFQKQLVIRSTSDSNNHNDNKITKRQKLKNLWHRVQRRSNTLQSAGIEDAKVAGLFGTIAKVHDPKTYLVLALVAALRWDWCFRSPYFWFAVGFCVKWYRARYVFKIPVWDRQPNWNNVITSKEQEKDLKAFTCKNCGSTIFIAKTREFFFEGATGIGGLGCFSCGAKGAENFVMDRDRIVEDVADTDDYFDYERPLDFVSAAARRKVLKEAKGDEDLANELLVKKANAEAGITEETPTEDAAGDAEVEAPSEEGSGDDEEEQENSEEVAAVEEEVVEEKETEVEAVEEVEVKESEVEVEAKTEEVAEVSDEPEPVAEEPPKPAKKAPAPKPAKKTPPPPSNAAEDDLDILGLD